MRCNQAMAAVIIMAVSVVGCRAHGCAEAAGVSVSKAIRWEISEFWRTIVLPLWNWEENVKVDEGDVPELARPAISSRRFVPCGKSHATTEFRKPMNSPGGTWRRFSEARSQEKVERPHACSARDLRLAFCW